jgi:hypothetical protein
MKGREDLFTPLVIHYDYDTPDEPTKGESKTAKTSPARK